jgi:multiple sugar transport system ATP-binding protein
MNFFSGKLDDNGARLQCSRLRLDLADLLQNALARLAGQALTVGVRPEDFHVADEGRAWISGAIDLIEDLGSDRFLHVKCDGIDLVARVGREITLRAGDTIDLNVAPDRLHFFRDGRRIEP